MKNLLLISLITIGLLSSFKTNSYEKVLPSLSLKNTEGETINVNSFAKNGKITAISFWATWCGPCIKELDAVNENYEDWQEEYNFELVAVSIDNSRSSSKVKPLVAGKGWDYEVLLDQNKALANAMNVSNPPALFLVDTSGAIVYTHTGFKAGDELDLEDKLKELNGLKEKEEYNHDHDGHDHPH
jgi:peroxiredoxin